MPEGLSDEAVAGVNCAVSQVIEGWRLADLQMGDSVVVQGAGGLGISAAASAKDRGASQVIVIDGQPGRLELARQSGADVTIDLNDYDTADARVDRVKELTEGRGGGHRDGSRRLPAGGQRGHRHGAAGRRVRRDRQHLAQQHGHAGHGEGALGPGQDHPRDTLPPLHPARRPRFPRADEGPVPLTNVMSHSFPLEEIGRAFEQSEWLGKDEGTSITRAFITP